MAMLIKPTKYSEDMFSAKFFVCLFVCLFVLRFYSPVNPSGSCRAWSVYLTFFSWEGLVLSLPLIQEGQLSVCGKTNVNQRKGEND